jgi:hypothetical protein
MRRMAMLVAAAASLGLAMLPASAVASELVADGSFEGGSLSLDSPDWTEFDSTAPTPLCAMTICGEQSIAGPRSGLTWAWLGHTNFATATSVAQSVSIPSGGTATLTFYLWYLRVGGDETLTVSLDGTTLYTANPTSQRFDQYAPVVKDVSAFADGEPHALLFRYVNPTDATDPNEFASLSVDDVSIEHTPGPPGPPAAAEGRCAGEAATIVGTEKAEAISGTDGDDVIAGLGGDDAIRGIGGDDRICGGGGGDTIGGGGGNDVARGEAGSDELAGGAGSDRLRGGRGRDVLLGSGRDRCAGGPGKDSGCRR